jgi:hypothetical protein
MAAKQSLAWARYRAGDWAGCIQIYINDSGLEPSGFEAMAYSQLGDRAAALKAFDRAIEQMPGYEAEAEKDFEETGVTTYPFPSMLRRSLREAAGLLGIDPSAASAKPAPGAVQPHK